MSEDSNSNTDVERVELKSLDVAEQKRLELLRLFPEVRTEGGKIDFDRLKLTQRPPVTADAGALFAHPHRCQAAGLDALDPARRNAAANRNGDRESGKRQ